MAATNHTTNYNLPQYIGTDKPTYLGDWNSTMGAIDTQMKTNADNASGALSAAQTAQSNSNTALSTAQGADTKADTALTNAATAQTTADNASSVASSALSTANSANTAASNAQTTADSALTNIGDLTNLNTTATDNLVNAINEVATNYIIESGNDTTTGFNYKKYSDGTAECWKNISGIVSVNNAWGNGLYDGTISAETFPTDLFIEVPCIFFQNISGSSLICMNSANASSTSTGAIQVARATLSNNAQYTISIKAIGKWK